MSDRQSGRIENTTPSAASEQAAGKALFDAAYSPRTSPNPPDCSQQRGTDKTKCMDDYSEWLFFHPDK